METDAVTLARLLSVAALMAATIEYAELMRRRQVVRAVAAERAETERTGLQALVRVLLADGRRDRDLRT